jgi:hypothetical protein
MAVSKKVAGKAGVAKGKPARAAAVAAKKKPAKKD